ncbi:MAG: serine protease [Pseudomonadota bacterium]
MFRALVFVLLLSALWPQAVRAEQQDIELAKRGVVRIVVVERGRGEPIGFGTGFAISNRKIVTNWHVIEAVRDRRYRRGVAVYVVPSEGDDPAPVRVLKVDRDRDLALLQTPESLSLPRLTLLDHSDIAGQEVVAIGYPISNDLALVDNVNALLRRIQRSTPPVPTDGRIGSKQVFKSRVDVWSHSATISPGNSGGPLVDDCGRVVGVNTFISSPDLPGQLNYSVTTSEMFDFLGTYRNEDTAISSFPCRPRAQIEAARQQYLKEELAEASARKANFETSQARLIEEAESSASSQRTGLTLLAIVLVVAGFGAGAFAVTQAQSGGGARRGGRRARKRGNKGAGGDNSKVILAGGIGALGVVAGLVTLAFIPGESEARDVVAPELEKLQSDFAAGPNALREGPLRCVLNEDLSVIRGAPDREVTFEYRDEGCHGSTQYASRDGAWTRVFVPREDNKARLAIIDPTLREYRNEIFMLGRAQWAEVRERQMESSAPSCGAQSGPETVARIQNPVLDMLPEEPNEEWIYTCSNE